MIPIRVKELFQRVGIDIKGLLRETERGNRYIIVAMNYLTKWSEAQDIKDAKTSTIAEFIYQNIICRHGTPEVLMLDRETNFTSQLIEDLCKRSQIDHRLTSAYRPQTNGLVERFNRTIGKCLAKLCSNREKDWDEYLDLMLLAYRTMKNRTMEFSPLQLLYGRTVKLLIELTITTYGKEYVSKEEALIE